MSGENLFEALERVAAKIGEALEQVESHSRNVVIAPRPFVPGPPDRPPGSSTSAALAHPGPAPIWKTATRRKGSR